MAGYRVKLICSGHVQELYEYSEPILTGYVSKGGRGLDGAEEEDKGRNKLKNIARCKAEIARLINKNSCSDTKFCSFTFAENVSDYDYCFNEWKKFVKRYNRYCRSVLGLHGFKLKYLVVWEFQKRGALHFHAVMFNAPYISNKKKDGYPLQKLWSNGHIWINKTDDNCDNLGLYVSKYLGKDLQATTSRKKYFTSRNLEKPEVFTDATPEGQKKIAEIIGSNLNEPVFSTQYEIVVEETIINSVNYTQFNSKRQGKKYGQAQKSCSNFVFPFENVC